MVFNQFKNCQITTEHCNDHCSKLRCININSAKKIDECLEGDKQDSPGKNIIHCKWVVGTMKHIYCKHCIVQIICTVKSFKGYYAGKDINKSNRGENILRL